MEKEQFLRLQYLRMLNSDEFVVELWRGNVGRFIADMWDRTPTRPGARFLSPIDDELGYSPDNVEWRFPKVRAKYGKGLPTSELSPVSSKPPRLTREERKIVAREAREAERQAKRQAIAEEFARWEWRRRR